MMIGYLPASVHGINVGRRASVPRHRTAPIGVPRAADTPKTLASFGPERILERYCLDSAALDWGGMNLLGE